MFYDTTVIDLAILNICVLFHTILQKKKLKQLTVLFWLQREYMNPHLLKQ